MELYENDQTFLPEKKLKKLTRELPTPFYLYDEKGIREAATSVFSAFSWNAGFREFFPMKTNPNPTVLKLLRAAGSGVQCTSLMELMVAERCGFQGLEILYAPLTADAQAAALAEKLGAYWMLDSESCLPPVLPARVLLCYNPGGKLRSGVTTLASLERNKFGMGERELCDLAMQLARQGVQSIGISMYVTDNSLGQDYYPAVAKALFELAVRLKAKNGICIQACNLCDGVGVAYRPEYKSQNLAAAAEAIRVLFQQIMVPEGLGNVELQSTLGRYLVAKNGILVTKVLAVKQRKKPLLLCDVGCGQFLRAMLLGTYNHISVLCQTGVSGRVVSDVSGYLADYRDRLGESRTLPPVKPGSFLIVHMAGAEGHAFSTSYGGALRCAEYLLQADRSVRQVGKAQTPEAYLGELMFD